MSASPPTVSAADTASTSASADKRDGALPISEELLLSTTGEEALDDITNVDIIFTQVPSLGGAQKVPPGSANITNRHEAANYDSNAPRWLF